jgi:hypothetical protein
MAFIDRLEAPVQDRALLISRLLNMAALFALLGIVIGGSLDLQFGQGEQPCPLCLVQRSAMIALAIGPLMNLMWGMRPAHYAFAILASLVGGAGAVRQILLHIQGDDPGFGPAVFGYHLYTWAFVTFDIAIVGCALLLMWRRPFELGDTGVLGKRGPMRLVTLWLAAWVVLDLLAIGLSILPQCGLGMCPDDPTDTAGFGAFGGWAFVLGLGVIALIIGAILDRKLPEHDAVTSAAT